jgi:branched-chain amino acid transport system permease protein
MSRTDIRAARSPMRVFEGPQTLGQGAGFWTGFAIVVALLALSPVVISRFQLINLSNFLIYGLLAMSLCLIWGYCGILSLGQALFLGLGGYAYGIAGINLIDAHGNTMVALLAGVLIPVLFAAVIGAVMFYAELKGVYVAILMMVVSRLFEVFFLQTADPSYRIGGAALGGFNGLQPATAADPEVPNLTLGLGDLAFAFDGRGVEFFYLVLAIVLAVYLGLRALVNSSFGYLLVGIREDAARTETFGYDVRLIQLAVFCLSAAIAGLSGVLYTAWGTYIHPNTFSIAANVLPVIWVGVAGRKDLTAALTGALILQWISLQLAAQGEYALIVMGLILVVGMMAAPEGVVVELARRVSARRAGRTGRVPSVPAAVAEEVSS